MSTFRLAVRLNMMALMPGVVFVAAQARGEDRTLAAPLKIQGYCTVSYFEDGKAVKGDHNIRAVYADDTYYFAKEEYKAKFEADPDRYIPQFGSWCTMALGGPYGTKLESDPEVFLVKDDKLYLFSSERAKKAYLAAPEGVLESAKTRFEHPWLAGYCPVALTEDKKGVEGDRKYAVVFRRLLFLCSSAEAKAKFAKTPQKYLPEYAGFDPIHLATEEFVVGNAKFLTVYEGKVYLFISEEHKKRFDDNPGAALELAEPQRIRLVAFK